VTRRQLSIRASRTGDKPDLFRMAKLLWPDQPEREVEQDVHGWDPSDVIVVERDASRLAGFVQLGERSFAEGCATSPIGYVEGWFVDEDLRRQGVGAALMGAALEWCRSRGYAELASDAQLGNETSIRAHLALGYQLVERIVCFRKPVAR
jgi:aminoglycoside 6'-N-acetyltransferase I